MPQWKVTRIYGRHPDDHDEERGRGLGDVVDEAELEVCGISAVLGDEVTGDGAVEISEDSSPEALFNEYSDRERVAPVVRKAGKTIMEE